jgi:cell division initiation protein
MNVSSREINEKQFKDAWRGYNQEEVDDFLDKVSETIEALNRENTSLRDRNHALEQSVATSREAEEMLKKTLVTAQRAAEEAIAKAKTKAEQLVTEAERRARGANEEARKIVEKAEDEARGKALEIEQEGQSRRAELDDIIEKLSKYQTELQRKLKTFLTDQQKGLDRLEEGEPPKIVEERTASSSPPYDGALQESPENGESTQPGKIVHVDEPEADDQVVDDPEKEPLAQEGAGASRRSVRSLFMREEG